MPSARAVVQSWVLALRGASPATQAGPFVREEIHHVREGRHGVRSPEQAIAIGLSQARRAGVPLPPPPKRPRNPHPRRRDDPDAASTEALSRHARKVAARKKTAVSTRVDRVLRDEDLDYLRDPASVKAGVLQLHDRMYGDRAARGETATEIAIDQPPIWIDVEVDSEGRQRAFLVDGRHRWASARRHGACRIQARVRVLDSVGRVLRDDVREMRIEGTHTRRRKAGASRRGVLSFDEAVRRSRG